MEENKKFDLYLVERSKITKNEDHAHLLEVSGLCPLCGKYLLAQKGKKQSKLYQIAHIYPNSPTKHQVEELDGLERLGTNCEDFENKISLCKDCHGLYDYRVTKEEYLKLLSIKKYLLLKSKMSLDTSHLDVEEELELVINSIKNITEDELRKINLKYKGVLVNKKFESHYFILKSKIEAYICLYYNYIKDMFRNLEIEDKIQFNIIAAQFRISYLKCAKSDTDKEIIFDRMVRWLKSKVDNTSLIACEIIVSFFVQNCEVFDEIT